LKNPKIERLYAMKQGFIQVYTGNGKGKTTAALGLALRAAGAGQRVYIGQFLKGQKYSELAALKRFKDLIVVEQFGKKSFIIKKPCKKDILQAKQACNKIFSVIREGNFNIVILDEINCAMKLKLIKVNDVLKVIKEKPRHVEIVLTGRDAPKEILKIADLVTEMKEIKHYFNKGIVARRGIEK
jgi:cob(I)alamin adenosyltransferase